MYKGGLRTFFQKSSIHLKISGARKVDAKQVPYRLSTNSRRATWCPGFEHNMYNIFEHNMYNIFSKSCKSNKHMDLNRLVAFYFESVVYVKGIRHKSFSLHNTIHKT